jgi:hypothetical protein
MGIQADAQERLMTLGNLRQSFKETGGHGKSLQSDQQSAFSHQQPLASKLTADG